MSRTDKIFWIGFVLLAALILKGYPGFYLLMTLFCTSFSIFYLVMGFWLFKESESMEPDKSNRIIQLIWRIIYGWACSVAILTLLFKVNNYPGFGVMAKVGTSVTGLVVLITIFQYQKTSSLFYKRAIIRLLPFFIFSFLCLLPMSFLDDIRRVREMGKKKYPTESRSEDWTPIIIKESDTTN